MDDETLEQWAARVAPMLTAEQRRQAEWWEENYGSTVPDELHVVGQHWPSRRPWVQALLKAARAADPEGGGA